MEKVRSDNFSRTSSADKELIERGLGRIEVQGDGLGPVQLNASSRRIGFGQAPIFWTAAQRPRKSSNSWVTRAFSVANRPCGAPSYSTSVACGMAFAAARPAASIGTVLSLVP